MTSLCSGKVGFVSSTLCHYKSNEEITELQISSITGFIYCRETGKNALHQI
jgi:hypothetical protein